MGTIGDTVCRPLHLHLPKGSKLLRYRRNPPEAVLDIPREPTDWCRSGLRHTRTQRPHTKRTVLLQQLLEHYEYPDQRLPAELRTGFPRVGWLRPSGIWPTHVSPPVLTPSRLLARSREINTETRRKVRGQQEHDIRQAIWEATQEEATNKWLTLTPCPATLPQNIIASVRFGVKQKNKIRPIDNFKGSHLNAACGTLEKVTLDSTDAIVNACLELLKLTTPSSSADRL